MNKEAFEAELKTQIVNTLEAIVGGCKEYEMKSHIREVIQSRIDKVITSMVAVGDFIDNDAIQIEVDASEQDIANGVMNVDMCFDKSKMSEEMYEALVDEFQDFMPRPVPEIVTIEIKTNIDWGKVDDE